MDYICKEDYVNMRLITCSSVNISYFKFVCMQVSFMTIEFSKL